MWRTPTADADSGYSPAASPSVDALGTTVTGGATATTHGGDVGVPAGVTHRGSTTARVSSGATGPTRFTPASALFASSQNAGRELWSPSVAVGSAGPGSGQKYNNDFESWMEKLNEDSKVKLSEEHANQVLITSLLQNLRKHAEEIEHNRWIYEDINFF